MALFAPATAGAAPNINCQQLNDADATQDYVISIIEESIGSATDNSAQGANIDRPGDAQVLECIRKTECTLVQDQAGGAESAECRSEYVTDGCTPQPSNDKGEGIICQRVMVFVAESGLGLLMAYIQQIYLWAAGTIGIVSVAFIVYGGVSIATAEADSQKIDTAKQRIMQSLLGLALLFLSAILLNWINPNFFQF